MNDNQMEALRRLRDSRRPISLHHSTGRSLADLGFAQKNQRGLWVSTDAGVACIDRAERAERKAVVYRKRIHEEGASDRHQRAVGWLAVHARLTPAARLYVDHVLDALLMGEHIVESDYDWEGGDELCRAWAEQALDAILSLEEAQLAAHEGGGDITVTYGVGEKVGARSSQRRAKVVRELTDDNVTSLDHYREARA